MENVQIKHSALSLLLSLSVTDPTNRPPYDDGASIALRDAADYSSTTAVAGMRFALPQGCSEASVPGGAFYTWVNRAAGLTVTAVPCVFDDASALTVGDVAQAADHTATAVDGQVVDLAVYENDDVTVCSYSVAFEGTEGPCMGVVGFVPVPAGGVNVLVVTCGADDAPAMTPALEALYGSVGVAA